MIKRTVFLFFTFVLASLHGQFSPEENKARNAYEAGMYPLTIEFYQQTLDTPIDPEQRSIALYDLGTVFLMAQDYANALKYLQDSLEEARQNPLLVKYAKMNIAITRLEQVKDLMGKPEFDASQGFDWLRSAEYDLQEAEMASCRQAAREGYAVCPVDPDIERIKTALASLYSKLPPSALKHSAIPSLAFLQGAIYAWKTEQPALAEVFLSLALEDSNNQWVDLDASSPVKLLRELIYHQRELQHIGMQMGAIKGLPENFLKAATAAQKSINTMAAQFYPLVYATQSDLFHQPAPIGNPDKRISQSPWDGALPLFDQGLMDSYSAFDALNKHRLHKGISKEESSATYWEQALAYLLSPPKASPAPKPEQNQPQEKEPTPQENQPPQQQSKESVEDILTHLQEMDLDSKPQGDQKALKSEGLPW